MENLDQPKKGGGRQSRTLSDKDAELLAAEVFCDCATADPDNDILAAVVMKIAGYFTYEDDPTARELSFFALESALYAWTDHHARRMNEFAEAAGAMEGSYQDPQEAREACKRAKQAIKTQPEEDDGHDEEEEERASRELAKAFATIEEYKMYIPLQVYNGMADSMNDFYHHANWSIEPETMRKALPHILRGAIRDSIGVEDALNK